MKAESKMTNLQIVQYLADGCSVVEISIQTGVNKRTIEKRISALKKATSSKNSVHLISHYFRKKLIY